MYKYFNEYIPIVPKIQFLLRADHDSLDKFKK